MISIIGSDEHRAAATAALNLLDADLRGLLDIDNVSFRFLKPQERFANVARAYRGCDNMNFAVCQGLYDPSERQIVIAVPEGPTILHESIHHFDWALGNYDHYHSSRNDNVVRAHRKHRRDGFLISSYAGVNAMEWSAETWKSLYVNAQPEGRLTDRARLTLIDPELITLLEDLSDNVRALYRQRRSGSVTIIASAHSSATTGHDQARRDAMMVGRLRAAAVLAHGDAQARSSPPCLMRFP